MSPVIGLVNYGKAGNVFNVKKALEFLGAKVKIVEKCGDFDGTDKIVLPGVGSFNDAMAEIEADGIKESLVEQAGKKHILGICLGMQILTKAGFEFGEAKGLGIVDGEARKINVGYKIPHMGWSYVEIVKENPIFKGVYEKDSFYFFHSLEIIKTDQILGFSKYNDYRFVSAIQAEEKGLFGVQFHPEKSRKSGLKVLKNFIDL